MISSLTSGAPQGTDLQAALTAPSAAVHSAVLDKASVAALSAEAIDRMTCDELARAIRSAELPLLLRSDLEHTLPHCDHDTLKRLAHLARRWCRNQGC